MTDCECVIHRLWLQFLTSDSAFRSSSQRRPLATTIANDRCLSLCERMNKTITKAELRSSLASSFGRDALERRVADLNPPSSTLATLSTALEEQ
ncbi:hypothetical protein TNCV_3933071 [Trichonephila clavipes]|nr:hypothetical protein TNCV_3933071 [Trichonephila clavipes]